MTAASSTPGYSPNAIDFMARRSLCSHGEFFAANLAAGHFVLDCGCGPGAITLDIAQRVAPGSVVGVDSEASQIERAAANADRLNVANVTFQTADAYDLPFVNSTFDGVFSHALMEHLPDPVRALREFRLLKCGGRIGICSPDWSGFVLAPPSAELSRAVDAYTKLQSRHGGDVGVGRKLGMYLASAGFEEVQLSARYENYPSLKLIGDYLAAQLEREGDTRSAAVLRAWTKSEGGLFAQAWVAAIAHKSPVI